MSDTALGPRARAKWAWDAVEAARLLRDSGRYASLAYKLPAMLQTSGLGQTMAFLYAKGGGPSGQTAEALLLRQLRARVDAALGGAAGVPDTMKRIVELDPAQYRAATRELQACLPWLKRFVEGRIEASDDT